MVRRYGEAEILLYSPRQPLNIIIIIKKATGRYCKKRIYFILKWGRAAVLMNPINFVNYPLLLMC